MEYKIFDSELKILEFLWDGGELTARNIAAQAKEQVGWSKTTTYTVLKKCVEKGLVASLLEGKVLSADGIDRLRKLVEELK